MTALDWPGCENARDLGGLPTASGGKIKSGAFVRTDRIRPQGVPAVLDYGVSRVIDLRLAATECVADPSPLAGHTVYRNVSVLRDEDTVLEDLGDGLAEMYRVILDRGAANLARVLGVMAAAPPGGVLVHCHSGKDRTGLVVALALELAGVAAQEIAADYARTAIGLRPDPDATPRSRLLFAEITAETMLATLEYLRAEYGGAEPYLLAGGLDPEDIGRVTARLGAG
ncbi:tyrosine-protein phosphatase [Nonomuraea sp. NBC_01738]|uniref:tyrosine-protein phosphatase n=1 Tax=Nonomuraea sp. NBC_01738 TaxID=2976003 RepID=UPI002E138403|nr:tyrosine-protein phosphatase [Nonomuraea sp. NBC_01738]